MLINPPPQDDSANFVQLYSKLAESLGAAGVVGQNPAALVSIQLPGVVVPPGLDPDDPATQYLISNLLNVTLECNYVVTTKAALVSDVYKLILDGKETPDIELTKKQLADLNHAQEQLYDRASQQPTAKFLAYQKCSERYYAALDTYNTQRQTHLNGGSKVPKKTKDALDKADKEWLAHGYKEAVQRDLAIIAELESRNPYVYWQALRERYENATRLLPNNSSFQEITSLPAYKNWFNQDLWTPFRFDSNDYKNQRRSGGTGMQAGGCTCCTRDEVQGRVHSARSAIDLHRRYDQFQPLGAWDDASATEVYIPHQVDPEHLELELSLKRINIIRPWMDSNVFYSRTWRWSPQSIGFGIDISTGGSVAGNQVASGVMPVLPTTALLAKDIMVRTSCEKTHAWLAEQFELGRMVRYGPFRLQGLREGTGQHLKANGQAVKSVLLGAPQIFGYLSTIFPQCPNPDGSLPWPGG
ncbi:hypothetical protein [Pseudomonas sp. PAMC 25886]|uniref:hypothetical protein n=1 Tax=Pseudomonas sp. PAMC 25886 TaxID=1125977 RepID=UPI00028905B1|nr:hypothetical protein [Pseudomonas sp. PAMC 25886]